jgi:hypothetical protein
MKIRLGRHALIAALVVSAAMPFGIASASTHTHGHSYVRCSVFKARGGRAGVYVMRGRVSCRTARQVLRGVADGKGTFIDHGYAYNSYYRYRGWACRDNIGISVCTEGKRPARHVKRAVGSSVCDQYSHCPRRIPKDDL